MRMPRPLPAAARPSRPTWRSAAATSRAVDAAATTSTATTARCWAARATSTTAWSYDAYAQYYYTTFFTSNDQYMNFTAIDQALLVKRDANGNPVCLSGGRCVPWNIFSDGGVTQDQLDFLYLAGTGYGTTTLRTLHGEVSGQLGEYGIKLPTADGRPGGQRRLRTPQRARGVHAGCGPRQRPALGLRQRRRGHRQQRFGRRSIRRGSRAAGAGPARHQGPHLRYRVPLL